MRPLQKTVRSEVKEAKGQFDHWTDKKRKDWANCSTDLALLGSSLSAYRNTGAALAYGAGFDIQSAGSSSPLRAAIHTRTSGHE